MLRLNWVQAAIVDARMQILQNLCENWQNDVIFFEGNIQLTTCTQSAVEDGLFCGVHSLCPSARQMDFLEEILVPSVPKFLELF